VLTSAAFDSQRQMLYVADMAQGAILGLRERGQEVVVSEYEDRPLKGPHAVVCGRSGNIYFTDCGPMGATHIYHTYMHTLYNLQI
jgi:sugar lactone lactonase YvrE